MLNYLKNISASLAHRLQTQNYKKPTNYEVNQWEHKKTAKPPPEIVSFLIGTIFK